MPLGRRAVNTNPRRLATGRRTPLPSRRLAPLAFAVLLRADRLPCSPSCRRRCWRPSPALISVPESGGSPNADDIDTLYKFILAVALVVFVGVEGALLYSLFKFRPRRARVAAQIRGNTRLEIGWTVGAAVILVVLAVFTFVKLDGIRNPPDNSGPNGLAARPTARSPPRRPEAPPNGKSLNICVNGQQYIWRYTYADDCTTGADLERAFSYEEMVVPVDTTVTLDITAQDVAHSWWIPKLGGKFDAIPGYTNHTWFKVPGKLGAGGPSSAASAPSCAGATTRT